MILENCIIYFLKIIWTLERVQFLEIAKSFSSVETENALTQSSISNMKIIDIPNQIIVRLTSRLNSQLTLNRSNVFHLNYSGIYSLDFIALTNGNV